MREFLNPPMPEQMLMTVGVILPWSLGMGLLDHALGGDPVPLAVLAALSGIVATLASFACEFGSERSRHRFYGSALLVLSIEGILLEHARPGALVNHSLASLAISLLLGMGLALLAFGSSEPTAVAGGWTWRLRPGLATLGTVAAALGTPFLHWGWKVLV